MNTVDELKDKLIELIEDAQLDKIEVAREPWCDYYAETDSFHIGTIDEDEGDSVYDAHISMDSIIDTFISDHSVNGSESIIEAGVGDARAFILSLRRAADKIESKIQQVKGSK